jgi:hypothetical protein
MNKNLNKWNNYTYPLNNHIITNSNITLALNSLKEKIENYIALSDKLSNNTNKLLILFKIKTINNQYRNISPMQTLDLKNDNYNKLYEIFQVYWNLRIDEYYLAEITNIIFSFKIIKDDNSNFSKNKQKLTNPTKENSLNSQDNKLTFGGYNLPNTMDILNWADIQFLKKTKAICYKKRSNLEYHIELFNNYQLVEVKLNDELLFSFKDYLNDKENLSSFTRFIKNQEYIYEEGKIVIFCTK